MTRRIVSHGGARNGLSHRPYRPTTLSQPARERDLVGLIGALFFVSLLLAAVYLGAR